MRASCCGLLAAPLLAAAWGAAAEPATEPAPLLPDAEVARSYFTDTPLRDQHGEERRFFSDVLRDHIVVINGFYTSCEGLSPRQSQVLATLQDLLADRLGEDVSIVSITVDPESDGVEELADYAREHAAKSGWLFLTGDPENVDLVNRKLGQFVEEPADHRGVYLLGNVRTGLWMKLPLHAMPTDLYRHVQRLLQDPGELPPE